MLTANLGWLYPIGQFKKYQLYLKNKETQQTLRVTVSIQYDASF